MQSLTTLRSHARTLAMASMLALAVISLPAVQAHAEPRQGAGDFGSCINPSDGQTYYPGERILSSDGRWMECQVDGSWKPVSLVLPGHRLPVAPLPLSHSIAP
jgi:hypothetical protein